MQWADQHYLVFILFFIILASFAIESMCNGLS